MGILRSVFVAAALAAPLAAAPAASADQFTCRFDGAGESMVPAVPPITTDLSADLENGRVELRTFGDCIVERTSGQRTVQSATMNGTLDYANELCGSMTWDGPVTITLQQEVMTADFHAQFRNSVGTVTLRDVNSNLGFTNGAGTGPAHVRAINGDCLTRPVDRFGFITVVHIRPAPPGF